MELNINQVGSDSTRPSELKFCPMNPSFLAVQSSRDLQIFELRKDFQTSVTYEPPTGQQFGQKYKLKVVADVSGMDSRS
jgi:hypothetical protein